MFGFAKKLFKLRKTTCSNQRGQAFPPQIVIRSGSRSISGASIDEQFMGMLLGVNSQIDTALNNFEKDSLAQIRRLLKSGEEFSRLFPRTAHVLPELQQTLKSSADNSLNISEMIEHDQALVGDLMHLYQALPAREKADITSLEQLVIVLGEEGMADLVTHTMLRPVIDLDHGHFVAIAAEKLSLQARMTASLVVQLCRETEQGEKADQHCFLAYVSGLLNNIGLLIGCSVLDNVFDGTQAPHSRQFQQEFSVLCSELATEAVQHWKLPDIIGQVMQMQSHKTAESACCQQASNLYVADRVARAKILGDRIGLDEENAEISINRMHCELSLKTLKNT